MIKFIGQIWNCPTFERITHRLGAYILLFSNLLLPLGLHRRWMRISGSYLWPLTWGLAMLGAVQYLSTHSLAWAILTWPWPVLFTLDFWLLAVAPVPTSGFLDDRKAKS